MKIALLSNFFIAGSISPVGSSLNVFGQSASFLQIVYSLTVSLPESNLESMNVVVTFELRLWMKP